MTTRTAHVAALLCAVIVSGCAPFPTEPEGLASSVTPDVPQAAAPEQKEQAPKRTEQQAQSPAGPDTGEEAGEREVEVFQGSDEFLDREAARPEGKAERGEVSGGVQLNFEGASLREVVKTIFGDVLEQNYVLEPGLKGKVTLNTSRPIPREDLIPVLESVLQAKGAAMVKEPDGFYRVGPRGVIRGLAGAPTTVDGVPQGYSLRIVPLKYIGAEAMRKVLEPIAPKGAFVRVDPVRNLLILAGTGPELRNMLQTINTFDVDFLKGMSVGIFQVQNVAVEKVTKGLDKILGEGANTPLAGIVRVIPVERLSSVMVITPRSHYLDKVRTWIERLDRSEEGAGRRLFVYEVQNSNASRLATMLSQLFTGEGGGITQAERPSVAPGLQPTSMRSGAGESSFSSPTSSSFSDTRGTSSNQRGLDNGRGTGNDGPQAASRTGAGGGTPDRGPQRAGAGVAVQAGENVRIVADEENNALVIFATEAEYREIEKALEKLDVPPMQVLIEASIMEVTLTGQLRYGFQWFFDHSVDGGDAEGILTESSSDRTLVPKVPGFSYTVTGADGVLRSVLNALASDSKLRVLSSPSVLVLDNRTAEIRVGTQQPVQTQTTFGGQGDLVTSSVEFRDTGVLLTVTPRVNAGGLVTMEVSQDVTDVGGIDQATGQRSFLQRNINSVVSVQSGETVVLGGLIRDNTSESRNGVPGLYRLPVIGNLFSSTTQDAERTELLVMLTPKAIRDREDFAKAGQELRRRMEGLVEGFPGLQRDEAAVTGEMEQKASEQRRKEH